MPVVLDVGGSRRVGFAIRVVQGRVCGDGGARVAGVGDVAAVGEAAGIVELAGAGVLGAALELVAAVRVGLRVGVVFGV